MTHSSFTNFTKPLAPYMLPLLALATLLPPVGAGTALGLGIATALFFGNPYLDRTRKFTKPLLSLCIIGLGAGMNLATVAEAGLKGISYTAISIMLTLALGLALGKFLKSDREASILISMGTAICGGSAIAAMAPVLDAKPHSISVSLVVVFVLNAIALFLFPWIGHAFQLSQVQFGLWSALSIHDTSSVVGAGLKYGPAALETGTTVKLARALWIVPIVLAAQVYFSRTAPALSASEGSDAPLSRKPISYPWFILGFLAMSAISTWGTAALPFLSSPLHLIELVARKGLILTLFLIGANLTPSAIRTVGIAPFLQGVILWIVAASLSLFFILQGIIH